MLSLAGVGTAYGWKISVQYLGGLWIGNNLVSFAVISGLAALLLADPLVRNVSLVYLRQSICCVSGWQVAFAGSKVAFIPSECSGTGHRGVTLQLIKSLGLCGAQHVTIHWFCVSCPEDAAIEMRIKVVLSNLIWVLDTYFLVLYAGVKSQPN